MRSVRETIYRSTQYSLERENAHARGYRTSSQEWSRRWVRNDLGLTDMHVQFSYRLIRPPIIDSDADWKSPLTVRWDL